MKICVRDGPPIGFSLESLKLVDEDHPALHRKAFQVVKVDHAVRELMDAMVPLMRDWHGVGLAAGQVGLPLQVFVMQIEGKVYRLANPVVVSRRGESIYREACLSVPGWYGTTLRSEWVAVEALSHTGKKTRVAGDGLLGQCLQHETDHLNGLLYRERVQGELHLKEEKEAEGAPEREIE